MLTVFVVPLPTSVCRVVAVSAHAWLAILALLPTVDLSVLSAQTAPRTGPVLISAVLILALADVELMPAARSSPTILSAPAHLIMMVIHLLTV